MIEFLHIYKKWGNAISILSNNSDYNTVIIISNTEYNVHNSHLHWHFIPRYENIINFSNNFFPADTKKQKSLPYNRVEVKKITNPQLRNKISAAIRKLL
jgi:diadenosine tetraphosphate (Ap4A) HIT family hydrolase